MAGKTTMYIHVPEQAQFFEILTFLERKSLLAILGRGHHEVTQLDSSFLGFGLISCTTVIT
jgi:hypothetical protein